tara:strand:+ start:1564 stop:1785 length:222 start_codon:yes stop_codon:yes gene_type:complete
MNTLKHFIKSHYKSNYKMAESLDVTPQTVGTWVTRNPRGALKYLPEITSNCQVTSQYFVNVVSCTEDEITKKD